MSTDRGDLTGPGASNTTKSNTGLWTKHRAIAYKVAGEFYLPGSERQDVEQEALIGLWIAARSWDRSKGSFSTFAFLVVRRRLATLLRSALSGRASMLTDAERVMPGTDVELVDTLAAGPDLERVVVARETLERLAVAVAALTDMERHAMRLVVNGERFAHSKQTANAADRARVKLAKAAA